MNALSAERRKRGIWSLRRRRPGGQAAKTPPFHGGNTGSIPVRVTTTLSAVSIWRHSSAGRASASHAEGHRFEFCCLHQRIPKAYSFGGFLLFGGRPPPTGQVTDSSSVVSTRKKYHQEANSTRFFGCCSCFLTDDGAQYLRRTGFSNADRSYFYRCRVYFQQNHIILTSFIVVLLSFPPQGFRVPVGIVCALPSNCLPTLRLT